MENDQQYQNSGGEPDDRPRGRGALSREQGSQRAAGRLFFCHGHGGLSGMSRVVRVCPGSAHAEPDGLPLRNPGIRRGSSGSSLASASTTRQNGLNSSPLSLKYFTAPGWTGIEAHCTAPSTQSQAAHFSECSLKTLCPSSEYKAAQRL